MKKYVGIVLFVFVVLSVLFMAVKTYFPEYRFMALEMGNLLMALLSLSTFFIVKKQMKERPQAFVRGVYSASLLRLMVCMIAVLVYVLLNRTQLHKQSVFVLFAVYFIYTAMETFLLSKIVRVEK